MNQFSSNFRRMSDEVWSTVATTRCPSPERVEDLLAQCTATSLGVSELAELLEIGLDPKANEQFEALYAFVHQRWCKPTGNLVRYVAPIYVSSFCVDACAYCNFSARRKTATRKRLTLEELDVELRSVLDSGARVIELVLATDPEFTTDVLASYVQRVSRELGDKPGSGVLLCSEYLSTEAYGVLRQAGLAGVVQWDETLDPLAFHRWHCLSPRKHEFYLRMDNHDRAQAAGLEVATGALLGLADYRYDVLMQVAKARHLTATHGRAPFVFGVPRLKPVGGGEVHGKTLLTDRMYETALLVYRIAEPEVGRWLQTRETFAMNLRNLLDGDVLTYRCGDVRPGGYARPAAPAVSPERGQFGVNELERDFAEYELDNRGFRINYAWLERNRTVSVD